MPKTIKLNIEYDYNFILIGIVTSEPIYRLSWLINEALSLRLAEAKSVQCFHKKTNQNQSFAVFAFVDEEQGGLYELIQNKSVGATLIEEQKSIDFFLKVSFADVDKNELLRLIKGIENINLALFIEPGLLKSKQRLITNNEQD